MRNKGAVEEVSQIEKKSRLSITCTKSNYARARGETEESAPAVNFLPCTSAFLAEGGR